MNELTDFDLSLVSSILTVAVIIEITNTVKRRRKIKERATRESKIGLTRDELENRLGESELMYEELEKSYWLHIGILVGVCVQLYLHNWYISVISSVVAIILGYKYLTIRPFTSGTPDIDTDKQS